MDCSTERNQMYNAVHTGDLLTIERLIDNHGVEYLDNWRKGCGLLNLALNLKLIAKPKVTKKTHHAVKKNSFCLDLNGSNVHTYSVLLNRPSAAITSDKRVKLIELLLSKGANVNATSKSNCTPLHVAAKFNHADCVKLLLDHGADANVVTRDDKTVLHVAVEQGSYESVQYLLNYCPDWKNRCNSNLLRIAMTSIRSNNDIVSELLNYGFTSNDEDLNDCQMFYNAINRNCVILVKHLLNQGFDTNKSYRLSEELIIPLHVAVKWAIKGNCLVNVELLLQHGANPNAVNDENETVLRVAVKHGSLQLVQLILKYCSDLITEVDADLLRVALFNKSKFCDDVVQDLMKYGFTLSDQDLTGDMFFRAVEEHCIIIVKELLKRGFEVNKLYSYRPKKGFWFQFKYMNWGDLRRVMPLHHLVEEKHIPEAQLLIDHGADVNAFDEDGKTAMEYLDIDNFSDKNTIQLLELLLKNQADLKGVPEILYLAIMHSKMELAERLLQLNVDVHCKDSTKYTLLHHAVERYHCCASRGFYVDCGLNKKSNDSGGFLKVIRLLLEKGADVNARIPRSLNRNTDITVLHIAASLGPEHSELLEMLLEFHADVNVCCPETSPLLLCILKGNVEFFRILLKNGANPKAKLADGKTYLHCVAMSHLPEQAPVMYINYIRTYAYPDSSQNRFVSRGTESNQDLRDSIITKTLVDLGVDINVKDQYGKTALHYAAQNKEGSKIIKRLIKHGADWKCRDNHLRTPLHCAAMESLFNHVATLVMLGADINCRDLYGCTPLHTLVIKRVKDAFKLLDLGSDINMTNNDDLTPFEVVFDSYKLRSEESKENDFEFSTIGEFTRHIIKLGAADLCVEQSNLSVLTGLRGYDTKIFCDLRQDYEDFYEECLREVTRLEQEKIGESDVTYYGFLTSTRNELINLARNDQVVQGLAKKRLDLSFPKYASELRLKVLCLMQVPRRESLLPVSMQAFRTCIIDVPEFELMLPNYLSDDDLESLVLMRRSQGILPKKTSINIILPDLNNPRQDMSVSMFFQQYDLRD